MAIFGLIDVFEHLKGDMAKARSIKKVPSDNSALIDNYLDRLLAAKTDRAQFEPVLAELKADKRLKSADVTTIAQRYAKSSTRAASKVLALSVISKRFVEIVRYHAKNRVAEKVRPW